MTQLLLSILSGGCVLFGRIDLAVFATLWVIVLQLETIGNRLKK